MSDSEKVTENLQLLRDFLMSEERKAFKGNNNSAVNVLMHYRNIVIDAIALLKEQGWNALTEDDDGFIHGLPGDDGQYLMTDGKDIWIDEYVDGVADGIILDSGRDIREITAWMYMPELPNKERR